MAVGTALRGSLMNRLWKLRGRLTRGLAVPLDELSEPGVYVTQRGDLLRVTQQALGDLHSPIATLESWEEGFLTRIAPDPETPIGTCRRYAAEQALPINF